MPRWFAIAAHSASVARTNPPGIEQQLPDRLQGKPNGNPGRVSMGDQRSLRGRRSPNFGRVCWARSVS